jgi:undecaprenyl-diphosphatase
MLLCAAGFMGIAFLVRYDALSHTDARIISLVQGWESPGLTPVMNFFSWMGTGLPLIILMLGIMLFLHQVLGHRKELLLFAAAGIGSSLLNVALKHIFRRPRPELNRLAEAAGFSFPSGHSMAAFSLYGILVFLLWTHTRSRTGRAVLVVLSVCLVASIGISRIYLGVHYPSDVLGGYLASCFWLTATVWLYQKLRFPGAAS